MRHKANWRRCSCAGLRPLPLLQWRRVSGAPSGICALGPVGLAAGARAPRAPPPSRPLRATRERARAVYSRRVEPAHQLTVGLGTIGTDPPVRAQLAGGNFVRLLETTSWTTDKRPNSWLVGTGTRTNRLSRPEKWCPTRTANHQSGIARNELAGALAGYNNESEATLGIVVRHRPGPRRPLRAGALRLNEWETSGSTPQQETTSGRARG